MFESFIWKKSLGILKRRYVLWPYEEEEGEKREEGEKMIIPAGYTGTMAKECVIVRSRPGCAARGRACTLWILFPRQSFLKGCGPGTVVLRWPDCRTSVDLIDVLRWLESSLDSCLTSVTWAFIFLGEVFYLNAGGTCKCRGHKYKVRKYQANNRHINIINIPIINTIRKSIKSSICQAPVLLYEGSSFMARLVSILFRLLDSV